MNPKKTIIGTAATAVLGAALLAGCGTADGLADDLAGSARKPSPTPARRSP